MVEGARLESVYAGNRIEGSNPSPSAKNNLRTMQEFLSHFLSHFYRHAGMRWRGLRIRRRDLLSKRIKAAKRNSPAIDKTLKKREKSLWYSSSSIGWIIFAFVFFFFITHIDAIPSFEKLLHEDLIAIHSGIGAVLIGLAFFVAQEIARGENNPFPYRGVILLKKSRFFYLLIAEVLIFFILFWKPVNIAIIIPIFLLGVATLFSVCQVLTAFLNRYELEKEERDMLFKSAKEDFLQALDWEMEQVIGYKEVASSLEGCAINMNSWFIHNRKEYTAIKSRKSGMVTDLDVQKLKEIASSNNDATEFGVDKPCYYLQVNSLHHDVKKEGFLLWVRNDLLANKKQKETIEKLAHEAFFIKPQSLNWESLQNSVGRLKELSLDLLAKRQQQEFREVLSYYDQLIETFYDYAELYPEDVRSQLNPSSILRENPNPIRWITGDIGEIFESSIEAKRSFATLASSLPFWLMSHAIDYKDLSVFEELRHYPYLLYKHSCEAKKAGNDEKANLLFRHSWRYLEEVGDSDLSIKAEDNEYPIDWIERFACAILKVFQDLLKISFDERNFRAFEKYLSVTTKLFENLENAMRYDDITRIEGLVESLNEEKQEVIFGLSSWILNKWHADSEKGSIEKFYNAIEAKMPSEIEPFTRLFLRCHHFDKVRSHGWNFWEFEGKGGGETYRVNSFAHLEQFYTVKALSLLAGYTDEQIATINLPTSRDFAYLADGTTGSVFSTLDHIKNNSDQWQPVLTDAAIEKVDAFKKLLAKAKEAQEQQESDEIKERPISQNLVRECKEKAKENFYQSATMRDIFIKHFNGYDNQTASKTDFKGGWFAINTIINKEIFLDNWYVDGSGVRDSFATSIARGENNYLLDEIANRCKKMDKEDFERTLAQFANVDDVVILTTQTSFWKFFSSLQNFEHDRSSGNAQGFAGWYHFNKNKIPVFQVFRKIPNHPVLIVDKTTVGRIVQLSPLDENGNPERVDGIFYMDIRAFSHDEELMNEFIEDPPQWLQKEYKTDDERREHLRGRVLIEIFERFQYEASKDFEGYILFT